VAYAVKLGSALTVARVGFFLEQHREPLMVEERHIEAMRAHAPGQPRYLEQRGVPCRLVSRWNLVVPEQILSGAWVEVLQRTYRIVYRVREDQIDVLTIFEGHRLLPGNAIPDRER
jgi:hypothetical protein